MDFTPEVTHMPLTSDMREPVAVAVGSALARLAGADAAPAGPAIAPPFAPPREAEPVPAPVSLPPAAVAPPLDLPVAPVAVPAADEEVDIPALLRELRLLADTSDFPRARDAGNGREVQHRAAG